MSDIIDLLTMNQVDIEKSFAAHILFEPLTTLRECGWLDANIFITAEYGELWDRCKNKINLDTTPDIAEEIVYQIALELNIALDLLRDGNSLYGHLSRPTAFAQELLNRARNIKVSSSLSGLVKAMNSNDHEEVDRILDAMSEMKRVYAGKVRTTNDIHDSFISYLNNTGTHTVETFIQGLDESLGGLPKQNLTVVAARPGFGKTAIAWQIARDVAFGGEHVAFFSCEMPEIDLWMRAVCPEVGISWRDVVAKRINPAQKQALKEESEGLKILLGDRMMIDDRRNTTDSIWQYVSKYRPALVIIDHLRLVNDFYPNTNENKRLGIITKNLKDMAKAFDCAVLCLAQLNRQVEGQTNKQPNLKDLRDSGEIEENADVVLFIHSPDFYEEEKVKDNIRGVQLWAEKNRNGQRAIRINLAYNLHEQRFYPAKVTTTNLSKI